MAPSPLRVVVADDERPARRFLVGLLEGCAGVEICGEAANGREALMAIEQSRPDLAFLDLQMPELGGLDVARRLPPAAPPLVAFVTAYDDFAIEAFELNAVDYVLKPAERARVEATLERARQRLRRPGPVRDQAERLERAASAYERLERRVYLDRLPVRRRNDVVIVPVRHIASITAEGELLHITTAANERHTIAHRLHALEARLDPRRFVRLGRGTLVNLDLVTRVSPMPGGTYTAYLANGQELAVSRIQSKRLRDTLLKI